MARKRRRIRRRSIFPTVSLPSRLIVIASLIVVLILGAGAGAFYGLSLFFTHSAYFKITKVGHDLSLYFLEEGDLEKLKGKNIFTLDLKGIQDKFLYKYPQVSHLKITRRFPSQLYIEAHERTPIAQTRLQNQTLTMDGEGIVLSTTTPQDVKFPLISGLKSNPRWVGLGTNLQGREIQMALKIIRVFQGTRDLSVYQISEINVDNLSRIELDLNNDLNVIVDWEEIEKKIKTLSFLLSQNQLDVQQSKYVDLRFKEPVIGKKKENPREHSYPAK